MKQTITKYQLQRLLANLKQMLGIRLQLKTEVIYQNKFTKHKTYANELAKLDTKMKNNLI